MNTTMQAHHIIPRDFYEKHIDDMERIFGKDIPIDLDDYSNRILMPQSLELAEMVRTSNATGNKVFDFEVGGTHHNTSHNGYSNAITEKLEDIVRQVDDKIVTPEVARMMVFDLHQQARALLIEGKLDLHRNGEVENVKNEWKAALNERLADPKDLQNKDSDAYKRVNDYQNNFNHQKFDVGKESNKEFMAETYRQSYGRMSQDDIKNHPTWSDKTKQQMGDVVKLAA